MKFCSLAALSITLLVGMPMTLASLTGPHTTVFYDNFDDGRIDDGLPITWDRSPQQPGSVDASSGDLVISPSADTSQNVGVAVGVTEKSARNVSARAQLKITESGGAAFLAVRGWPPEHVSGYVIAIAHSPLLGGSVVLAGIADGADMEFVKSDVNGEDAASLPFNAVSLPYDVRTTDTVLQVDAMGDNIEYRAWRAGDPMPSAPLFQTTDSTWPSGSVGIGIRNNLPGGTGQNTGVFRYVFVDGKPINDHTLTLMKKN